MRDWLRKFLENEGEIDMSRRVFLKGIAAASALAATKPIFVFAPRDGWIVTSTIDSVMTYTNINTVTMDYVTPALTDNIFKMSPIFTKLRGKDMEAMCRLSIAGS